jgi:hypothetical protein
MPLLNWFRVVFRTGPKNQRKSQKDDLSCTLSGFSVVAALELFGHILIAESPNG